MSRLFSIAAAIACLAGVSACSPKVETPVEPEGPRTLRIIQNGSEDVGYVRASEDGDTVTIEYWVNSNGRGPKHTEIVELGDAGVPVSWSVSGTSLMGADVTEDYTLDDGVARWTSQADFGEIAVDEPTLYAVNDGSPWGSYLYTRALLADDDQSIPVLPAGEMTLETVGTYDLGEGEQSVTVYRLGGLDMSPTLLALDEDGEFFAQFSAGSATILEGSEHLSGELQALAEEMSVERTSELATTLTHTYEGGFAVSNVRVFDPVTATLSDPVVVSVSGNEITSITPYVPGEMPEGGVTVFDGAGGTLMSGLWDMHSHASAGRGLYYLAAGVTSTRDMGNNNEMLAGLLEDMEEGKVLSPRITPAGFIEGRSLYSSRNGIIVESEEEAVAAVDWYAERGFPFIKIYNSMTPAWVPAMVDRASEHGMRTIGHVPAFTNADAMIEAGYSEITHINQLMLGWMLAPDEDTRTPLRLTGMARGAHLDLNDEKVQHTVQLMQENNVGIDPTAVILERLMLSRAGEVPPGAVDILDHMPIGYQRYRKRTFVSLADEQADLEYQEGFQRVLDTIAMLYEAGITILPGTDDGTGFTVHRELELYERAGIPTGDVLRIATWGPVEHLGYEAELGSIEPGKLADFVLLPGNPLDDLRVIKRSQMVVRDGEVFFPEEIYTAMNIEPFSTSPTVISGQE